MGKIKYDVFISKSSDDQALADSLVTFLEGEGLSVFESKRNLPRLGNTDYQRAIFEALDKSASVLVVCSENENGSKSNWVRGEWSWFLNEILSGRRSGQIMTVRKGIEIKDVDIQLRMYESFDFDKDFPRLVEYVKPKAVRSDDSQLCELHFGTDLPCEVFQFGKHVGHVDPDGDFFLKLRPGKYKFRFDCLSEGKSCSVVHTVPEAASDYLEVELEKTGASTPGSDSASVDDSADYHLGHAFRTFAHDGHSMGLRFRDSGPRRIQVMQGTYSVILNDAGKNPDDVAGVLQSGLAFERADAERLVRSAPSTILSGVSINTASTLMGALEKAGASVEYTNAEKEGLSMKHDVFLVYSRRNLDKARFIYGQLKFHGISCWLDNDGLSTRGSFLEKLMDTIKASKTVVFLSSRESNASRSVIDEISWAVKYGKKVIPVLLDDAPFAPEIDYVLPGVDCLSFQEDYLQKLIMRIQLAQ